MAALIVCDDRKRIRYVCTGWPGCTHDQRVYDNSTIALRSEEYFSPSQCLLADSGFTPTRMWFRRSSDRLAKS